MLQRQASPPEAGRWIEVCYHPPPYGHFDFVVPTGSLDELVTPGIGAELNAATSKEEKEDDDDDDDDGGGDAGNDDDDQHLAPRVGIEMIERLKHVPAYLPPFPDVHAYKKTRVCLHLSYLFRNVEDIGPIFDR